jgi:hypothetical protein
VPRDKAHPLTMQREASRAWEALPHYEGFLKPVRDWLERRS